VHIEELVWISSSQLEGAGGPDHRDEVHQDKEVRRALSQGASDEGKKLALSSVPVLLFQNLRSGIFCIQRLGMPDDVTLNPFSALLHRFAVHRTEALGFDQSHRAVKFRGVAAVEHRGTAAVDPAVRDDAID
jgi:hypothetical protein